MQRDKFYRPSITIDGKRVYLKKGPNDIGKASIPIKDRCEDFDELWSQVFNDVMSYWEEVTDIHEFDQYESVDEDDEPGAI